MAYRSAVLKSHHDTRHAQGHVHDAWTDLRCCKANRRGSGVGVGEAGRRERWIGTPVSAKVDSSIKPAFPSHEQEHVLTPMFLIDTVARGLPGLASPSARHLTGFTLRLVVVAVLADLDFLSRYLTSWQVTASRFIRCIRQQTCHERYDQRSTRRGVQ